METKIDYRKGQKVMNYDTAGNEIKPTFLYPCPARCGLTGGCSECNLWMKKHAKTPSERYRENELSQDEEERFYAKIKTL